MKDYDLLSIEEVAKLVKVSERTIYDWAKKGEIPAGKFGTTWRFKKTEILKWIDQKLNSSSTKEVFANFPVPIKAVLSQDRVVFLNKNLKEDVLAELVNVLATAPQVHSKEELLKQIYKREELMSTGIGLGIAVPHVRINSIDDIVMAVGICKKPILDYESLDQQPVSIICMIAAHTDQHAKHIKLLSSIAKSLRDDQVREQIINSNSVEEVKKLFMGEE